MRLVSWNVNGLRAGAAPAGLGRLLGALGGDVVCLQETKISRVATFCKDSATPEAAEEGLSGLLTKPAGAIGCYGDTSDFTPEELQVLDSEGRAIITRHRICTSEQRETTLTLINVYCPCADPDRPDRGDFKLRFYRLLERRAEALLKAGGHVVIVGDINTAHKPIDHCDPGDLVRKLAWEAFSPLVTGLGSTTPFFWVG
uniref:exodeoxyribonuclease III n=1 Tax=Sphenodon punctatus TaxID=8508 RepID=A0A8D0HWW1_SPHPU